MPSEKKPYKKASKGTHSKSHDYRKKQPDYQAGTVPVPALFAVSSRHSPSRRNTVINVEDIKSRAFRTEDLTQRAHRFNFQLAIDLREKLQSEFDALERLSADPQSGVPDLKMALMTLSNKISSDIEKQIDVQKKIAEAYRSMYQEVTNMAKRVLTELERARLTLDETDSAARLLGEVMSVIRETVEFWSSRPEASRKKLNELTRNTPRETMGLGEMFDHLEIQIKLCHKALEHPMAGAVSISMEFAKVNIYRKSQ